MMDIEVHPHALVHGLSKEDVRYAWEHYAIGAVRVPLEREVRIGFDQHAREIEMVGVLLGNGSWLVIHAMTPPTRRMRTEIRDAMRRG